MSTTATRYGKPIAPIRLMFQEDISKSLKYGDSIEVQYIVKPRSSNGLPSPPIARTVALKIKENFFGKKTIWSFMDDFKAKNSERLIRHSLKGTAQSSEGADFEIQVIEKKYSTPSRHATDAVTISDLESSKKTENYLRNILFKRF